MDPRRLELLLELSRLGSMHEVADALGVTTSTVSQQIAALAREVGTPLLEPRGSPGPADSGRATAGRARRHGARRDRSRPGRPRPGRRTGRRGAGRGVRDGDPYDAAAGGARSLAGGQPAVRLRIHEHEPSEAMALLATDDVDLALTYDYNLAPAGGRQDGRHETAVGGRVGPRGAHRARTASTVTRSAVFDRFRDDDWIVNSRNTADEDVVRIVASLAGFRPRVTHRVDSLELVQDMVAAGLGVGLLPADQPIVSRASALLLAHRPRGTAARVRGDATRTSPLATTRPRAGAAEDRLGTTVLTMQARAGRFFADSARIIGSTALRGSRTWSRSASV